jgi:hypothetical protein
MTTKKYKCAIVAAGASLSCLTILGYELRLNEMRAGISIMNIRERGRDGSGSFDNDKDWRGLYCFAVCVA